jgi:hypothetical protein
MSRAQAVEHAGQGSRKAVRVVKAAEESMGVLEKLRTASIEDMQGRRTIEGAWGPLTRGILAAVRLHDFEAALNLSARAKARPQCY